MRFHILGMSHTKTTKEYSCCAFTQKVRVLCRMLTELGHTVYHYGVEGSDPICTEHVTVLSDEEFKKCHSYDWKTVPFDCNYQLPTHQEFLKNVIPAIRKRAEKNDFLLCTFGLAHKVIAEALPYLIAVESGIGYNDVFAKFKVFESYAWMHFQYGKMGMGMNPNFYDAVIPNYLEMENFPFVEKKEDFFLFLGRMNTKHKGASIADDACQAIGAKLYTAGQGDDPSLKAEHLGVLGIEEKAKWMGRAKALFCPTYYIEPFGTVSIEALACGTPVIATDFGAFTENIQQGVNGFRCRTMAEFVNAARNIDSIATEACRKSAERFSTQVVGKQYEDYFYRVLDVYIGKGFYAMPKDMPEIQKTAQYVDKGNPHLGGYTIGGDPATFYPELFDWLVDVKGVKSVIDVGCGEGHSLKYFKDKGCKVIGIDGIAQNDKLIFKHDYAKGIFRTDYEYDLAWVCEFVEHIEEKYIPNFLATLACAKMVLMTHGEPGQAGWHHVNNQTAEYWKAVMAAIGYSYNEELTKKTRELAAKNIDSYNHYRRSGMAFNRIKA
jgi:glycosyltransferase involved in cell wall biosynthesis